MAELIGKVAGKLIGKRALITGGSSGIGLAVAQLFASEGAVVSITGRSSEKLDEAKRLLPISTHTITSDTGNLTDIAKLVQQVAQTGKLDILILNAGHMQGGTLLDVAEEQFDQAFDVNVKGPFFLIQEAVRQQLFAADAAIVVVTSIVNQKGRPGFTIYAASKAALSSIVRSLSLELIGSGIRMNAVSPGPVNVGLSTKLPETVRREITEKSPIKRFAQADEIAQAILFLASHESAYLVGAEIVVDGGISLRP